ncbi:hypothetical protein F4808DRAFT_65606 [Astrocystis sublimbata]|nr:hypothetical protein F4808DRAFT_65606 [Astrocystis sublimbata]
MEPPKPVNGALIPATASITGQHAAAHCQLKACDANAVLTPLASSPSTKLPLSRKRQQSQQPVSQDYDPDLVSKDKSRQKEAIRRFLADRIRNDWVFKWQPASSGKDAANISEDAAEQLEEIAQVEQSTSAEVEQPDEPTVDVEDDGYHCDEDEDDDDDNHEVASIYSVVSEDSVHFTPRAEWLSDLSDDDNDEGASPIPYRFETPDAVGSTVKATELARSAKQRRAARAEMEWNSGLACFSARRDAWTGARIVRVRCKPMETITAESTSTSPTTKRLSFWRLSNSSPPLSPTHSPAASTAGTAPLSPSGTRTSADTTAVSSVDTDPKEHQTKEDLSQYPVQTLLPIAEPLIPAANIMRASIRPASYDSIYDKIVVQAMTPACPVNLADMLRACVVGWKRDGEWPPRPTEVPPVVAVRRKRKDSSTEKRASIGRRLSLNLLGRRQSASSDPIAVASSPPKDDAGVSKGAKRGWQRVFGLGQENHIAV